MPASGRAGGAAISTPGSSGNKDAHQQPENPAGGVLLTGLGPQDGPRDRRANQGSTGEEGTDHGDGGGGGGYPQAEFSAADQSRGTSGTRADDLFCLVVTVFVCHGFISFSKRERKLALQGVSGRCAAQTPLAADQQGTETIPAR